MTLSSVVLGDFNPVSTSFDEKHLINRLKQISLPTRSKSILDWCLVNTTKACFVVTQLPPLDSSDHNCIFIKSHVNSTEKTSNKRIYKRDLRESKIRHFGQTLTLRMQSLPSHDRNRYFLPVVDEFSRFPFVFRCPDMTASIVIKCLTTLFFSVCQLMFTRIEARHL